MKFSIEKSLPVLERTPKVLYELLSGLDAEWISSNDGGDTWSPFDVLGHLVHGEKTDWIARVNIILGQDSQNNTFIPFDRFAQFEESKGRSTDELLSTFASLRKKNISYIKSLHLSDVQLELKAIHPSFGEVTLQQLLSTWAVHDLAHLSQITRVMARQYKEEIGPWLQYINTINY